MMLPTTGLGGRLVEVQMYTDWTTALHSTIVKRLSLRGSESTTG